MASDDKDANKAITNVSTPDSKGVMRIDPGQLTPGDATNTPERSTSTNSTPNSTPNTENRARRKGRIVGATAYTAEETSAILDAVEVILPATNDDWEQISVMYASWATANKRPYRSGSALKKRFTKLYSSNSPQSSRAQSLRGMILRKCTPPALANATTASSPFAVASGAVTNGHSNVGSPSTPLGSGSVARAMPQILGHKRRVSDIAPESDDSSLHLIPTSFSPANAVAQITQSMKRRKLEDKDTIIDALKTFVDRQEQRFQEIKRAHLDMISSLQHMINEGSNETEATSSPVPPVNPVLPNSAPPVHSTTPTPPAPSPVTHVVPPVPTAHTSMDKSVIPVAHHHTDPTRQGSGPV